MSTEEASLGEFTPDVGMSQSAPAEVGPPTEASDAAPSVDAGPPLLDAAQAEPQPPDLDAKPSWDAANPAALDAASSRPAPPDAGTDASEAGAHDAGRDARSLECRFEPWECR